MSGRDAEERADAARVRARLEAYYGRYYGGTLGIPGWRELVAVRLDDMAYERERLTRLEMARVLRPGGALYIHTPNRWTCFEGHYKLFWLPGLPRPLAAGYLALRGRPTGFLRTLRPLTLAECRALVEAAGARVTRVLDDGMNRPVGGPLWPLVRAYYLLFGVRPYVELVATRGKAP